MLKILQIEKTNDFFQYQAKNINSLSVITPNPQVADLVRKQFSLYDLDVETLTISKFIKDELNHLEIDEILENYKGKSELTLLLGAIWKKIGKEPNITKFEKAFNLLTEFRSFSLSDQVLETVLDEYDSELKESVLWFHRFLNELEIVDEHKSYFLLSEKLRTADINPSYPQDRQIIFYGFDYLAASQIDLLKSLALRNDVIIPIYKEAYAKAQGMDWIKWFDEHNLELIDIASEKANKPNLNYSTYPKGYLAKFLKQNSQEIRNILLGTNDFSREYLQEIPLTGLKSKTSVNLFEEDYSACRFQLENYVNHTDKTVEDLRDYLQQLIKESVEKANYRQMKSYSLILNKLNLWESLSDSNKTVNSFDLSIIMDSSELDLPRTNLATLQAGDKGSIKNLKSIDELKGTSVWLVLNEQYLSISSSGSKFTENVEKYLASIGPIRRAEFELNVLKAKLKELALENELFLLVQEGMLEHDTGWSDLLESFQLNQYLKPLDFNQSNFNAAVKVHPVSLDNLSASKLQKYLDCPQLYFQQYGLKQSPIIDLPSELSVLDLGQLQHKVIEKYFDKSSAYIEDQHIELIQFYLNHWCEGKKLNPYKKQEYFIEIYSYTRKTIELLCELKEKLAFEHKFELDFSIEKEDLLLRGSVDCFLHNSQTSTKIVLDFKRSNSVFMSYKTILEYEQIQLWFYLMRLKEKGLLELSDRLAVGYIDLSNQENSMLFVNDEQLAAELKTFGFKKISTFENLEEQVGTYDVLENETIGKMKKEISFLPHPRSDKACHFCGIKNICPKESHGNS